MRSCLMYFRLSRSCSPTRRMQRSVQWKFSMKVRLTGVRLRNTPTCSSTGKSAGSASTDADNYVVALLEMKDGVTAVAFEDDNPIIMPSLLMIVL